MGNPRVFDGKQWTDVPPTTGSGKPVPPVADGDGTIFVSVASYRDGERCGETLKSIFENAKNPEKVIVGLSEQNAATDTLCLEAYCQAFGLKTHRRTHIREDMDKVIVKEEEMKKCPHYNQVRKVAVHHLSAKGPMYARAMTRKILGNEEFCAQVDAHTAFVKDWDELAKEEWKKTANEFAVISNVPAAKAKQKDYSKDGPKFTEVPRQCKITFRDNGFPDYDSPADGAVADLEKPLLSHGWSAAFSFAKCHLEESAPYDAFAWYAMPIEQFSRYARLWTRGYDVYTPTRNIVFHDYEVQPNGHGNNEWFKHQRQRFRKLALTRVKTALHVPSWEIDTSETVEANLGLYGLGKRRSLKQLEEFTGVDVQAKRGNPGKGCVGHEFIPYDASISPVANLYDKPDNLDPQPEYPLRTNLVFYEQVVEEPLPGIALDLSDVASPDQHAHADSFHKPPTTRPTLPPLSMLSILWVFGLIVWCIMFMNPQVKKAGTKPKRKKKKWASSKDV